MTYFYNLLVATDQLGNALCGGNPNCSISARAGYNAERLHPLARFYWRSIAAVIDFTFWPVQGWGRCKQAYLSDRENTERNNKGAFPRFVLSFLILFSCIPISMLLYTCYPLRNIFVHDF